MPTYAEAQIRKVSAANGIDYAYREVGAGGVPLVLLIHTLGFSLGSFVAQDIALTRPTLVRRLVLASSAPQGVPGTHGWAKWVIDSVGEPEILPAKVLGDSWIGRRNHVSEL